MLHISVALVLALLATAAASPRSNSTAAHELSCAPGHTSFRAIKAALLDRGVSFDHLTTKDEMHAALLRTPPLSFFESVRTGIRLGFKKNETVGLNSMQRPFAALSDRQIVDFLDANEVPAQLSDLRLLRYLNDRERLVKGLFLPFMFDHRVALAFFRLHAFSGIAIDATIDEMVDAIDAVPLHYFLFWFFLAPSHPLQRMFSEIDNESYIDEFLSMLFSVMALVEATRAVAAVVAAAFYSHQHRGRVGRLHVLKGIMYSSMQWPCISFASVSFCSFVSYTLLWYGLLPYSCLQVFTYIQIFLLPLHYISSLTLSLSNAIVPFQKLLVLVAAPGMIDDLMNKVMERDQLAKEVLDLDDTVQKLHRQQTQEASAAAPAVDHAARMKELELQACRATQALEAKQSELSMATANLQNMMQEHSRFRKFLEPVIQFDEVKFDTDQNNKCVVIARTQNAIVFKGRYMYGPVAIKVLEKKLLGSAASQGLDFDSEIKVMCHLSRNPLLVRVYGAVDQFQNQSPPMSMIQQHFGSFHHDFRSIVMELCDGTLDDALNKNYTINRAAGQKRQVFSEEFMEEFGMTDNEALIELSKLNMLIQIAEGLQYMHAQGFVHRDLKPENIFLRKVKKSFCCVLGDFGITAEHNSTAAQAGTNTFRAPETYQMSTGLVTCTADVFSFAMIMYILRLGLRLWCTPKNEAGEMKQPDEGTFKARGLIAHVPCNRPPVWEDELELQANWTRSAVVVRQIGFKVWDTTNNLWKRETAPLVFQPQYPSAYDKKYVELMQKCWDENPNDRPSAAGVVKELKEMLQCLTQPSA